MTEGRRWYMEEGRTACQDVAQQPLVFPRGRIIIQGKSTSTATQYAKTRSIQLHTAHIPYSKYPHINSEKCSWKLVSTITWGICFHYFIPCPCRNICLFRNLIFRKICVLNIMNPYCRYLKASSLSRRSIDSRRLLRAYLYVLKVQCVKFVQIAQA